MGNKKTLRSFEIRVLFFLVVPLGLEPRLFGTKNRRVASYTIGQFLNVPYNKFGAFRGANVITKNVKNKLSEEKMCNLKKKIPVRVLNF